MMHTGPAIAILVAIILIVLAGLFFWPQPQLVTAPPGVIYNQTVSDGTITFGYNSPEWGLATTPEQVLAHSYIPACDEGFAYCLYYNGSAYQGTNFESAGLTIKKRPDLATQSACLQAQPDGYAALVPLVATSSDYVISKFAPLGDAGAGHYATDTLYRLSYGSLCYEFRTRIGETQFANYPAGSIKQFTDADRTAVQQDLQSLISNISLPSGGRLVLP